jgi:hypothetical protein
MQALTGIGDPDQLLPEYVDGDMLATEVLGFDENEVAATESAA